MCIPVRTSIAILIIIQCLTQYAQIQSYIIIINTEFHQLKQLQTMGNPTMIYIGQYFQWLFYLFGVNLPIMVKCTQIMEK